MEIGTTLFVTNRDQWRQWLKENAKKEKEIWLIYYKKHTKKPTIPYDHAVEEALCFGWIDSTVKRIDDETYAQRYTPRKLNSVWSQHNIKRVKKMMHLEKMRPEGLMKYEYGMKNNLQVPTTKDTLIIPADLQHELDNNHQLNSRFSSLSKSTKIRYIYWINRAKKEETRKRRIQQTMQLLEKNKIT